ncbi:hypothetical protein BCY76_015755 [Nesterenkonia sp. PF2B19]|nr:hypothetical protein BCY76_015755 [Nesterenkonia sp. PF2B19]
MAGDPRRRGRRHAPLPPAAGRPVPPPARGGGGPRRPGPRPAGPPGGPRRHPRGAADLRGGLGDDRAVRRAGRPAAAHRVPGALPG